MFDYDNQFIAAEKYNAKYSYKNAFGYFPGIAQVDLRPFYIENRDGNAQVKLGQGLRHYEQRLRLETPALLVHSAEHGLHILTALIGNFFAFLDRRVAESGNFGIEATSRAKRFLFNFIQVPFRRTHSGRRWLLQIYSDRPYDKLKL